MCRAKAHKSPHGWPWDNSAISLLANRVLRNFPGIWLYLSGLINRSLMSNSSEATDVVSSRCIQLPVIRRGYGDWAEGNNKRGPTLSSSWPAIINGSQLDVASESQHTRWFPVELSAHVNHRPMNGTLIGLHWNCVYDVEMELVPSIGQLIHL